MRTLLVVSCDEEFGGVASVVGNLARYLQSMHHQVICFNFGEAAFLKTKTTKWGFPGYELRLSSTRSSRLFRAITFLISFPVTMFQLMRLIQKHRIQIVNIHYPSSGFFYFAVCRRIFPILLVTSVHGADIFPKGIPRVHYSWRLRFLLQSSDLIIAPSQSFRKDFSNLFPHLREKTTFIHNGVNLAELNEDFQDRTSTDQKRYILCIAMHNEKKGLDVLLHAFSRLKDIEPSLKLVLIGDGPLRGELEDLSRALGINGQVEFLGVQQRAEVAKLLAACEVFVLPSRSEPFGIVIIEAMASRKPVVATRVGGIPEIIENGTNGILVEPDDPDSLAEALTRVLKNQTFQRSMAKNGYNTVQERFSCEKTGAAYERVFGDLLESYGKRAFSLHGVLVPCLKSQSTPPRDHRK